jgi:hypothetical protein
MNKNTRTNSATKKTATSRHDTSGPAALFQVMGTGCISEAHFGQTTAKREIAGGGIALSSRATRASSWANILLVSGISMLKNPGASSGRCPGLDS